MTTGFWKFSAGNAVRDLWSAKPHLLRFVAVHMEDRRSNAFWRTPEGEGGTNRVARIGGVIRSGFTEKCTAAAVAVAVAGPRPESFGDDSLATQRPSSPKSGRHDHLAMLGACAVAVPLLALTLPRSPPGSRALEIGRLA